MPFHSASPGVRFRPWTAALLTSLFVLTQSGAGEAIASTWNPAVLVNTEAFQVIDETDTVANIELRFGDTLDERMRWDRTGQQFQLTDDLEILGTASGANLYATKSVTGAHLYASVTFGGAGLTNCTGAASKLTWLSATRQFSCETDQTGGGAAGIVDHYVRANGDTMTGGLLIESRASGTAPGTIDAGLLLEVRGTASGTDVFAQKSLRSSGSFVLRPTGSTVPTLYGNGAQNVGIRTATPGNPLEVVGTASGLNLYATNAMTGAHLNATTTFGGAGLANCTGASSKLTWLSSTKQFACETDQTGAGGGGATTSGAFIQIIDGIDASAVATNLALNTLNCVSDPSLRVMANFSRYTKIRFMGKLGGTLDTTGAGCGDRTCMRLQYHTGGNPAVATGDAGWTTLANSAGGHTASTWFYTSEASIPAGARINSLLIRACIYGGDGVQDPTITGAHINILP